MGRAKYLLILLLVPIVFASIYAQEKYQIPAWVKGVAGFWAEDKITDDEFGEGLSFLISQDIIKVPEIEELKEQIRQLEEENAQLRSQLGEGGGILQDESLDTCMPVSETCDGLDNDCDGMIDEGNPQGGVACNTGLQGICQAGTRNCESGVLVCDQNIGVNVESCDGLDNDCDGMVDDGNPGGGAACSTGLSGACSAGTMTCSGGSLQCQASVAPAAETCDGLDNDCDSTVDDGAICSFSNAAGTCSAGVCTLSSCNAGFANCDGSSANGCEQNIGAYSNTIDTPTNVGSHCADTKKGAFCSSNSSFEQFASQSGTGGRFFKATADECSACAANLEMKFTLIVPNEVNYDLFVIKQGGPLAGSSTNGAGIDESVTISIPDSGGGDDTASYIVEVRYISGSSCSNWTLNAFGHPS